MEKTLLEYYSTDGGVLPEHCSPILTTRHRQYIYLELINEGVIEEQALQLLRAYEQADDGLTDGELAEILHLPRSTISARRNDLIKLANKAGAHVLVCTGERRKNPGIKSKTGIVWKLYKQNEV